MPAVDLNILGQCQRSASWVRHTTRRSRRSSAVNSRAWCEAARRRPAWSMTGRRFADPERPRGRHLQNAGWPHHDAMKGVVGTIEPLATALLALIDQGLAAAERDALIGPVFAVDVSHHRIHDLAQQRGAAPIEGHPPGKQDRPERPATGSALACSDGDTRSMLPLPHAASAKEGRTTRELKSLLHRKLVEEAEITERARSWRREDDRLFGLQLTNAAREALGPAPDAAIGTSAATAREVADDQQRLARAAGLHMRSLGERHSRRRTRCGAECKAPARLAPTPAELDSSATALRHVTRLLAAWLRSVRLPIPSSMMGVPGKGTPQIAARKRSPELTPEQRDTLSGVPECQERPQKCTIPTDAPD